MGTTQQKNTAQEQHVPYMNQVAPAPSNEARVSIVQTSEKRSSDEDEQHPYGGVDKGTVSISPRLRASLLTLGMRNEALAGWAAFHVSPAHAMGYFFPSIFTLLCGLCYLQFSGVPFTRYYFTIPCMVTITITFSYMVSIWRVGPLAAWSKLYLLTLPLSWIGWSTTFLVCFLGPPENIPFGNLIHFLIVVGVCLFSGILANKSGMLFMDHPKKPRTSMLKPLLQSVVSTARIIDNFTDLQFIRIVYAQKADGCIWFGHTDRCLVYNIILPALVLSAMGDFLISVGMIALGTEATRMSKRKKRALLVMHVVSLLCELGIVAVTLASLLSSMRHPDRDPTDEEQTNEMVATVVSLVSTFVTFILTMIGAGDAVQGLKAIGRRISTAGWRISVAGQRISAAGQTISESGSRVVSTFSASGHHPNLNLAAEAESDQLLLSSSDAASVSDEHRGLAASE